VEEKEVKGNTTSNPKKLWRRDVNAAWTDIHRELNPAQKEGAPPEKRE